MKGLVWALLLSISMAPVDCASPERTKQMVTNEQIAQEVLGLKAEAFFGYDDELDLQLTEKLSDYEFEGLAIQAPHEIDVRRHGSLPVIAASVKTGLRQWEVDFKQNCMIVAVDLNSGELHAARAFPPKPGKRQPSPKSPGPKPNAMMAEATITGTYCFDLRKVLELPWRTGSYAVTLISYDWCSNTVVVCLKGDEPPERRTSRPIHPPLRQPRGSATLPKYEKVPQSPPLAGSGIAFAVASTEQALQQRDCPVFGSIRLSAAAHHVVDRDSWKGDQASFDRAYGKPAAVAVVPATVALVGKNWKGPERYELQVPVFATTAVGAGEEIEAFFAVNLLEGLSDPLPAGDYRVYLFVGRNVAGPTKLAIR